MRHRIFFAVLAVLTLGTGLLPVAAETPPQTSDELLTYALSQIYVPQGLMQRVDIRPVKAYKLNSAGGQEAIGKFRKTNYGRGVIEIAVLYFLVVGPDGVWRVQEFSDTLAHELGTQYTTFTSTKSSDPNSAG